MNYFIVVLLIVFPVYIFAADEKENTPPERFILDQSRLDSGAVLGGAKPDSELVQKAEAGDVEAMVRLYDFYRQEGETTKANDYLNKAAEKGHIPSLKLIYQQTGKILSVGLEAAVSVQVFAPLRSAGGRTEFGLMHFSYMDHLSSVDGLQQESSRIRSSIISQITDGEKDSLVETSETGDRMLRGQQVVRPFIVEPIEDGTFKRVELKMGADGDYLFPPIKEGPVEGLQEKLRKTYEQAKAEGRLLGEPLYLYDLFRGDSSQIQIVSEKVAVGRHIIEAPVLLLVNSIGERVDYYIIGGYKSVTRLSYLDAYVEVLPEDHISIIGVIPRLMDRIIPVLGRGGQMDSLTMLGRYVAYRLENSETQMKHWLNQLKRVANTGDILALQMVYRITGEVLMKGYTLALSNTIDSIFAERRELGSSPKLTAMQNQTSVSDSVMEKIKAPFVEGVEGLMFDLYEMHREKENTEGMTNWLNQLKKRANTGHVPTLRIVYHMTGEVLATGLNTAVSSTMNSLFTEGREQGTSPKITAMQNQEGVRSNILGQIKTPFGRCAGGF